ncbi:AAA family ATPase [Pseudomonas vancouverensis]|uniref:AAA family ATPase n=1 Tax=Pseudomonas vancouverensis TaxID=95300 RepID=UPI003D086E39
MTIYSFAFENFFSFEAQTEVSFVTDKRTSLNDRIFEPESSDDRVSKVLAVVGANGSGKTNLIKPLTYLLWFMTDSFFAKKDDRRHFIRPHIFNEITPVTFKLEFDVDGVRYRYILLRGGSRVYFESLEKKTSRLWSKVFIRKWDSELEKYDITRKNFGSALMPLAEVGDLVSLISLAAQYKSKVATTICSALRKMVTNVTCFGRNTFYGSADVSDASDYYYENETRKEEMLKFLREQDFGINDIELEKYDRTEEDGTTTQDTIAWIVYRRGEKKARLPILLESNGTQAVYHLLSKILPLLQTGGIVIYDELEGDLHPLMIEPILNLFFSKRTNPFNAQIIFTTHSIEVLNLLQKNQILLVEKNEGSSEAWKLSDMEGVRSDDNFYAKYMSGAYGAVPRV